MGNDHSSCFILHSPFPLAAAVLMAAASSAHAHRLSFSHGTASVCADRVEVRIEASAEDFVHHDPAAMRNVDALTRAWLAEAAARYERFLLDTLVIRDAAGERLAGRAIGHETAAPLTDPFDFSRLRGLRASFRLDYPLAAPPRYLTFYHADGAAGVDLASQLVLFVTSPESESARTIRLTSRGNVETLAFDEGNHRQGACTPPPDAFAVIAQHADSFKSVLAGVEMDDGGMTVRISVPLTLLETWRGVPRADRDFLSAEEQQRACASLGDFFARACEVRVGDRPVPPEVQRVTFIGLDAAAIDDTPPPARISAWTARVDAVLRLPIDARSGQVELIWQLFNNAVLSARAVVCADGSCAEHELSTYSPRLTIDSKRTAASPHP